MTAAIYAPNADVTISGNANFNGAAVSNSITLNGGVYFHYDEGLADFYGDDPTFKIDSWTEIYNQEDRIDFSDMSALSDFEPPDFSEYPEYPDYNDYETYDPVTMTYTFDFVAWDSASAVYYVEVERLDNEFDEKLKPWRNIRNLFQVAGYPLGFYLGQRYFGQRDYSFGDAYLLSLGRWGGALYGIMIADILDLDFGEQDMAWRWTRMGGAVGGMVGMDKWIEGYNYSFGQGFLMSLGALAGVGFSIGVGVILEVDDLKFYEITGMMAALGGMALVKANVNPGLERAASGIHQRSPVQLSILPMAGSPGRAVPGLTLQLRW